MALQTSGQISMDDIRTEFNVIGSIELSDLYRGGSIVPNTTANNSIPTSGEIKLSDFYGAEDSTITYNAYTISYNSTSSTNACSGFLTQTVYSTNGTFQGSSQLFDNSTGTNTANAGFYSDGSSVLECDNNGFVISSSLCGLKR